MRTSHLALIVDACPCAAPWIYEMNLFPSRSIAHLSHMHRIFNSLWVQGPWQAVTIFLQECNVYSYCRSECPGTIELNSQTILFTAIATCLPRSLLVMVPIIPLIHDHGFFLKGVKICCLSQKNSPLCETSQDAAHIKLVRICCSPLHCVHRGLLFFIVEFRQFILFLVWHICLSFGKIHFNVNLLSSVQSRARLWTSSWRNTRG